MPLFGQGETTMEEFERHCGEGWFSSELNESIIARAWRDDEYLESLSEQLRSQIPENPDDDIDISVVYRGGQTDKIWAGPVAATCSTTAASCSPHPPSCTPLPASSSTL